MAVYEWGAFRRVWIRATPNIETPATQVTGDRTNLATNSFFLEAHGRQETHRAFTDPDAWMTAGHQTVRP
jgi:hypothetical protein